MPADICAQCAHFLSAHRLTRRGDLVDGPYRCTRCRCSVPQETSMRTLSDRRLAEMSDRVKRAMGAQ